MSTLTGHSPESDTALLERYADGGAEPAFREIVERHAALVLAIARRQTGDEEAAREVAQKTFVLLARKASQLRRHPSITGWLYTVCRMECRSQRREAGRRARLMRDFAIHQAAVLPAGDGFSGAGAGPAGLTPGNSLTPRILDEAMDKLPEADRQVLLSRYAEGCSFADIAGSRRVSEAAARKQVSRAVERLAAILGTRRGKARALTGRGSCGEGLESGRGGSCEDVSAATLGSAFAHAYPHPSTASPGTADLLSSGSIAGTLAENALRAAAGTSTAMLTFPALTAFMTAKATLASAAALIWIASVSAGWQAGVHSKDPRFTVLADSGAGSAAPDVSRQRTVLKSPALPPGQSGTVPGGLPRQTALRDLLTRIAADFESSEWDRVARIRGEARLAALSNADAAEALALLRGVTDPPAGLVLALWQRRGQAEGEQAVKEAMKLPLNPDTISCQRSALGGWGRTDPAGALRWVLQQPPDGFRHMGVQSIFNSWTAKDPSAALDSATSLADPAERAAALTVWARESGDHTRRADLMQAILATPESDRGSLLASAASQWRDQPQAYGTWLQEHDALTAYGIWPAAGLSSVWAQTDPAAAATWLRQTAGTQPEFPETLSSLIMDWAVKDAPGASEWLAAQPQGPELDPAIETLTDVLPPNESEAIKGWAARLHDRGKARSILRVRGISASGISDSTP